MQTAERTRFTEAEMATVRDTDLPDLLISLGYQVKRIGRYYTTQEMDSIRIKDRRTWFRYSEGIGGDAITFLQRFYNKSFPEAVEYLLTWHGRARDSPPASTPRQTKEKEEKFPFTAIFGSMEIPAEQTDPAPTDTPSSENSNGAMADIDIKQPLLIGGAILLLTAGGVFLFKRYKGRS